MDAAYVFRVAFRLTPERAAVDPEGFETTVELPASEPGTEGWLRFRDRLWRGAVGDEPSFRRETAARLGVADAAGIEVCSVDFRELRTDREHLEALKTAIAADLARFNTDSVDDVLRKYFGSSIHVREA
jgi:hypothetical protein